jgi:uncharacterized membrane protein YtjA (UPF0391 family)
VPTRTAGIKGFSPRSLRDFPPPRNSYSQPIQFSCSSAFAVRGYSQWAIKLRLDLAEVTMLYWALVFLIVAIVAAIFGFGGIAVASAGIAKILFFIFLVLFVVSLIFRGVRRV